MYFIINCIQVKRGLGNINNMFNKSNLINNAPNND